MIHSVFRHRIWDGVLAVIMGGYALLTIPAWITNPSMWWIPFAGASSLASLTSILILRRIALMDPDVDVLGPGKWVVVSSGIAAITYGMETAGKIVVPHSPGWVMSLILGLFHIALAIVLGTSLLWLKKLQEDRPTPLEVLKSRLQTSTKA